MRTIPAAALAKVNTKLGTEPVIILAVEWRDNAPLYYADKDISDQIKGKILNKSEIDSVINLAANSSAASLSIVLDDTDGSLKTLLNNYDLHKRPAVLYQWFDGLSVSEKFPVFSGEVASPIIWNEGERTLSFSLTTKVEDKEAGFSPESGQFPFVSEPFISKPWPMVFGRCVHVPAQKVRETVHGQLREVIALVDSTLEPKLGLLDSQEATLIGIANRIGTLQNLASDLAPAAGEILQNYIQAILDEDVAIHEILDIQRQIADLEEEKAEEADIDDRGDIEADIDSLRDDLDDAQDTQYEKTQIKQGFEFQTQQLVYEHKLLNELDGKAEEVTKKFQDLYDVRTKIKTILAKQQEFVKSSFRVAKGRLFPQGVETDIIIDDIRFRGTFDGDVFTVSVAPLPKYTNIAVSPTYDAERLDTFYLMDSTKSLAGNYCLTTGGKIIKIKEQNGTEVVFDLVEVATEDDATAGSDNSAYSGQTSGQPYGPLSGPTLAALSSAYPIDQKEYTTLKTLEDIKYIENAPNVIYQIPATKSKYAVTAGEIGGIAEVARIPLPHWFNFSNDVNIKELPDSTAWHADAAADVQLADDYTEIYVANILPSTVHAVHAYRSIGGVKQLVPVPTDYYTKNEDQTLGNLHVTSFILRQPLSAYQGEYWDDGIYVTLTSSVGPNTADIIQHLVETYTGGTIDTGSFSSVHDKIDDYPMDFAYFERRNALELINDIAWQARCAVWENNGIFYLRYLSEQPVFTETITQSDAIEKSISLEFSRTEDLVTKFVATFHEDYTPGDPIKITLRHNVNKYGTNEKDYDFFGYTNRDCVEKSATFWMIRYCNTWKTAKFQVPHTKLKIETLDAVLLNFSEKYFSTAPVTGIVQTAAYDSAEKVINLEVWLPVRAGEMVKYDFAWPSDLDVSIEFPTQDDVNTGAAGSGFPDEAVGTIGDYSVDLTLSTTRPSDYGHQYLGDGAWTAPGNPTTGFFEIARTIHDGDNVQVPNDAPIDPEPQARPDKVDPLRNAFIGRVLTKIVNKRNTWRVAMQDGAIIEATQQVIGPFEKIKRGTIVYVVRGNQPDEWFMQAKTSYVALAELKIVSIEENHLVCSDPDNPDNPDITVAKPFHLQPWFWDDETINHIDYKVHPDDTGSFQIRTAEEKGGGYKLTEMVYPEYDIGVITDEEADDGEHQTIICAQMPFAVPCGDPDDPDAIVTNWIDMNVEGRQWRDVWQNKVFDGKLLEVLNAGGSARVQINDNDGLIPGNSYLDSDYADGYDSENNTGGTEIWAEDYLLATGSSLPVDTLVIVARTHKGIFKVIAAKC